MDTSAARVAVISLIIEDGADTAALNDLLHEAGRYIIGRMGIPYRPRGISIMSIAIDAPQDIISALSGRIGRLPRITAKTAYARPQTDG